MAGTDTSQSREKRTRNLFYVCCSRAKEKLIVADLGAGAQANRGIVLEAACEICADRCCMTEFLAFFLNSQSDVDLPI